MVRRQNRDLDFDDEALRQALNWSPRPFEPASSSNTPITLLLTAR